MPNFAQYYGNQMPQPQGLPPGWVGSPLGRPSPWLRPGAQEQRPSVYGGYSGGAGQLAYGQPPSPQGQPSAALQFPGGGYQTPSRPIGGGYGQMSYGQPMRTGGLALRTGDPLDYATPPRQVVTGGPGDGRNLPWWMQQQQQYRMPSSGLYSMK